jgi:hypothetical protein
MSKEKQDKIETIEINGQRYVREDQILSSEPKELDGLRYAIVRSGNQGVMSGYVVSVEGQSVTLKRARQIWRYDSRFVLADMAEFGVRNADDCKFSTEMSQDAVMLEACGILYCTKVGADSIISVKAQDHG